jgi:hypothetical protein
VSEPPLLEDLLDDTEAQLLHALATAEAGGLLDLSDLPARIERICTIAVENRAVAVAPRLAALVTRLDALETVLRLRIAESGPDPRRAAQLYRAAASPRDESAG